MGDSGDLEEELEMTMGKTERFFFLTEILFVPGLVDDWNDPLLIPSYNTHRHLACDSESSPLAVVGTACILLDHSADIHSH